MTPSVAVTVTVPPSAWTAALRDDDSGHALQTNSPAVPVTRRASPVRAAAQGASTAPIDALIITPHFVSEKPTIYFRTVHNYIGPVAAIRRKETS
ncbi:hypothetical protein GCM10027408_27890 [Microbacterium tumbae]